MVSTKLMAGHWGGRRRSQLGNQSQCEGASGAAREPAVVATYQSLVDCYWDKRIRGLNDEQASCRYCGAAFGGPSYRARKASYKSVRPKSMSMRPSPTRSEPSAWFLMVVGASDASM